MIAMNTCLEAILWLSLLFQILCEQARNFQDKCFKLVNVC